MLRMNQLVFDDAVEGTTATYTDVKWNEAMGSPDYFFVAFIASQVSGSVTLTITAEMSPDGVNWGPWGATPPVSAKSLTAGTKTMGGSDAFAGNGFRFMRLKIELAGTTPAARLQVYWIGRDVA